MEPAKSIRELNQENTNKLWEVLQAYRGEPLKKYELIELCDFNNAAAQGHEEIFRVAMKHCRKRAEELGLMIPMASPDSNYTYVLTGDPTLAIGGYYHSARVAAGMNNLYRKHSDFIDRNSSNLDPSMKRLFDEIKDGEERLRKLEMDSHERQEDLMKDLAKFLKQEKLEREKQESKNL